jgi:hypothetical protein
VEFKHATFFVGLALVLTVGRVLCQHSARLRDVCAFLLVFGTTRADMIDINFLSREWYRGTTRGIEASWLDLLWILLLVSLPRDERRPFWIPGLGPMILFLAYNAVIVAYSDPAIFGLFELSKMARQLGLFITMARYVKSDDELVLISQALALAVAYEFVYALRNRLVWKMSRAAGTLGHANALSMYELMAVPVLAATAAANVRSGLRKLCGLAAVLGAITVLLTVSRNGILTIILLGIFLLLACGSFRQISIRHLRWGLLLGAVFGVLVPMTRADIKARYETDAFASEYGGKAWEGRGAYLLLAKGIVAREPFGCGLNNWSWCVSNRYGTIIEQYYVPYVGTDSRPPKRRIRRHAHIDAPQAAPAHSLYAITLGETGWPGVILLGLVWARWFSVAGSFVFQRSSALRSRFGVGVFGALLGAFGQSLSEWEIRLTPLAFLLHILLGAATSAHVGNWARGKEQLAER